MPALPSIVTSYLTQVKNYLSVGPDLGSNIRGAAANGLNAMDMSACLELLQNAITTATPLTALGGSSASQIVDGAATFTAGQQVGNYVVVVTGDAGNVGVLRRISANTTTTLTFESPFPAAIVNTNTYNIVGGFLNEIIDALRQGKRLADANPGSVYGEMRTAADGIIRLVRQLGGTLLERTMFSGVTAAGSSATVLKMNFLGMPPGVDALAGLKINIAGTSRIIISSDETSVLVAPALSAAPAAGVACTVVVPEDNSGSTLRVILPHPGLQTENAQLAALINQAQTAVIAYTLPS